MAALPVEYEGNSYVLDMEDMDTDDARVMERFGVPNLKALVEGIMTGDLNVLTVCYWLMLKQNGEPGVRIDRVKFKPIRFFESLVVASAKVAAENAPKGEAAE